MSNEETILFVIFFSIAFILIYKYIRLDLKKKAYDKNKCHSN